MNRPWRALLLSLLIPFAVLSIGCQQNNKALSAEDETNPHFHAAMSAVRERNYVEAAKAYEAALRAEPNVAQAHYELGLLYSDHLADPIAALYHFQEYLKLRPNSDLASQAQARLDAAKINFAATLPNSPVQNAEAFAKLQSDNQALHHDLDEANGKVADLEGKLASAQKEIAAATPNMQPGAEATTMTEGQQGAQPMAPNANALAAIAPVSAGNPAPAATTTATTSAATPTAATSSAGARLTPYTISSGDTLWKIAKKFYPGHVPEGIDKIKAANPDALPAGKPLKIGTVIQIPQ